MKGDYPRFRAAYEREDLAAHFLLTASDLALIAQCRGDVNRHGVAVLLKSLCYLGYFPDDLREVPREVREYLAGQLSLLWDYTPHYPADERTRRFHLSLIREHTGWRAATARDKEYLERWLREEGARTAHTEDDLMEVAYECWREEKIELPAEKELRRTVNAALHGFFQALYARVAACLSPEIRAKLDQLLIIPASESVSAFEKLKADPRAPGVENLKHEIEKLQQLRAVGIKADDLADVPAQALLLLKRRARNERAGEMREHPAAIRYTLLACFIQLREREVTDDVTRMMLEIIHRLDAKTEQQLDRELLRDSKKVAGKVQILFKVAAAVTEEPDGRVREVIFSRVKEEVFRNLVAEFKASGPQYRILHQSLMRQKYAHHYRQMLPVVLEHLTFRSENRYQPVIEALEVIKENVHTHRQYLPDDVPLQGVVTRKWQSTVIEEQNGETRINRKYYELCVLQKLKRALKCKEIWVEGAEEFRNPAQDLPREWEQEEKRVSFYQTLKQPVEVSSFLDPLRDRLVQALTAFDRALPGNPYLCIQHPKGNPERGLFKLTKLDPQPEPQSLGFIKEAIGQRYGMLDLLDVFLEADRLVNFTRHFTHSGTKEMRSREALRPCTSYEDRLQQWGICRL